MKGVTGRAGVLARKFSRRRCRTAKNSAEWVRGPFWLRPPEISRCNASRKLRLAGKRARISVGPPVVAGLSDVISKLTMYANPGSGRGAGVVTGAWQGSQVFQTLERGSGS